MITNTSDRIKNLLIVLLFFTITTLMLINILPFISISQNEIEIFYNYYLLQNTGNIDTIYYSNNLQTLINIFWVMILLSIISLNGIVISSLKKFYKVTYFLIYFSYPVLFFNIYVIYKLIVICIKVIEDKTLSLSYIFEPFRYCYIILLFLVIMFFVSLSLFLLLTRLLFEYRKNIKEKESIDKKNLTYNTKDLPIKTKNFTESNNKTILKTELLENNINQENRKSDIEAWVKKQTFIKIKNQKLKSNLKDGKPIEKDDKNIGKNEISNIEKPSYILKEQKDVKIKEELKSQNLIEKKSKDIFKDKKTYNIKDSSNHDDKISFDNVLDNVIKKRKEPMENQEIIDSEDKINENKIKKSEEIEQINIKDQIKIKCPKCNFIFPIIKGEKKVKCPNCEKEGVVE